MFEMPCVILCGGKSSRMGEDKALLPFSSKPTLTQYQYDRLKPFFKNIYISSKIDKFDFEANLIIDRGEVYSPIIALDTVFDFFKDEAKVFILTVDTPLVSIDTIEKLIQNSVNNDICVAKTERTHNLCGVFSINLKNHIKDMIDKDIHKVGYLLQQNKTKIIQFEEEDEFINLNHPSDYEKSLSIISAINK